jgi:molybdate transport system substrate-binding protein
MTRQCHRTDRRFSGGRAAVLALAMVLAVASRAATADIIVLTAGAFKPVLLELAPAFEASTHNTLAISNDTAGGVTARVVRGEEIDLVVLPKAAIDGLAVQGKIIADSVVPVAKSGIGMVVKEGQPLPDISTVEAFKRTMLAAPSFAYIDPASGGSSGIYLAKLFDQLGIAEALRRTAVLVPGGLVGSRVDDGEAALGLQQMSELRAVHGVTVVGPLPAKIQNYTIYAAGIPSAARHPAAARALLEQLHGEAAVRALTARGLELP